jgi:hypothetical protein
MEQVWGFDREIMTTDNLGAFYAGNISSARGDQLVLPLPPAPAPCSAGCGVALAPCDATSAAQGAVGGEAVQRSRRILDGESRMSGVWMAILSGVWMAPPPAATRRRGPTSRVSSSRWCSATAAARAATVGFA